MIVAHNIRDSLLYSDASHAHDGLVDCRAASARCAALARPRIRSAATLEVSVVDEHGKPIANVAVYATPAHAGEHAHGTALRMRRRAPTATMDQQSVQFVPHLLVVQAGTEVTFPNSDNVSHHVYSFSADEDVRAPALQGRRVSAGRVRQARHRRASAATFTTACSATSVVVDTPHFAVTNEQGVALIDGVPSGDYVVAAWTPRVRPDGLPPAQQVAVASGAAAARFASRAAWRRRTQHGASSLTWDRY